eukprot:UN22562
MVFKKMKNAPERTRTAYMYFCDKHRDDVMNNNPDAIMVEVSAMLGKMWSETSEKSRAPFVSSMEKSKSRYEKEMEVYRQTSEYVEFQKRKNLHNLIANMLIEFLMQRKELFIKVFQPILINLKVQIMHSFYLQTTTGRI